MSDTPQSIPAPPPGFQIKKVQPNLADITAVPPPPPGFEIRPAAEGVPPVPPVAERPDEDSSVGRQLSQGFGNVTREMAEQLGAAWQGTAPMVRNERGEAIRPVLGEFAELDSGYHFKASDGQLIRVDPNQHVILRDPLDDVVKVFQRTKDSNEALAAAARMIGLGSISTAPTRLPGSQGARQALPQATQLTQDFQLTDVNPTLAAVNQGRVAAMVQQGAANTPVTAGPVSRAAETSLRQTADATEQLAGRYGTATTPFQAGDALKRGAETFKSQFLDKTDKLYDAVGRTFKPDEVVDVPKSLEALGAPSQRFHNVELGQQFVDPKLAEWADIIQRNNGQLTWNDLRTFRSEIGRKLAKPAIISDVDRAQLERVYASLSDDMMAAAQAKGPAAVTAVKRANQYYKAGLQRINGALKELLTESTTQEGAYQHLFKVAQEKGAKASAVRLTQIRRSMPGEEWGDVASTILMELGKPVPSARSAVDGVDFSVQTFMTNFSRLSDAAKNNLFSGGKRGALRPQLERLGRVISAQKEVERLANTSNTAMSLASIGITGALFTAPTTTILTALAGNVGARLIMNPRFVGWLNKAPKQKTQVQWLRHMASLRQIGAQDPETREAVNDLLLRLAPEPQEQS